MAGIACLLVVTGSYCVVSADPYSDTLTTSLAVVVSRKKLILDKIEKLIAEGEQISREMSLLKNENKENSNWDVINNRRLKKLMRDYRDMLLAMDGLQKELQYVEERLLFQRGGLGRVIVSKADQYLTMRPSASEKDDKQRVLYVELVEIIDFYGSLPAVRFDSEIMKKFDGDVRISENLLRFDFAGINDSEEMLQMADVCLYTASRMETNLYSLEKMLLYLRNELTVEKSLMRFSDLINYPFLYDKLVIQEKALASTMDKYSLTIKKLHQLSERLKNSAGVPVS